MSTYYERRKIRDEQGIVPRQKRAATHRKIKKIAGIKPAMNIPNGDDGSFEMRIIDASDFLTEGLE